MILRDQRIFTIMWIVVGLLVVLMGFLSNDRIACYLGLAITGGELLWYEFVVKRINT